MLMHSVFFWLKDDLSAADRQTFLDKLNAMKVCPSVRLLMVGTPSSTDRPVIDRSYSFALHVAFDDLKGHDDYQAHPLHDDFRDSCAKMWTKVVIYDCET